MGMRIVGISGSPVGNGNVEAYLDAILDEGTAGEAVVEHIHLSQRTVGQCTHCNFCLSKQKDGRYCSLQDDAQPIFEAIERADVVVLASPVYFMRTSAQMAALIDRLRVFIFGNVTRGRLRNKIGVSAAVAWLRNGGLETTHLSHLYAFLTLEMIPASVHTGVSPLGASALSSEHGEAVFDPSTRLGAVEDAAGLASGRALVRRALELAELCGTS